MTSATAQAPLAVSLAALSVLALVPLLSRAAGTLGLIDHPGGRKTHSHPVPLVGGLAIFCAMVMASLALPSVPRAYFGAVAIVVTIGVLDDAWDLRPRFRFAAQIFASLVMIYSAGVELVHVGDLLGHGPIGMWLFATAGTVFAVVGVINSVNMLDGMDGLAGSVGFVALAWYAIIAGLQGLSDPFTIAALAAAAVGAFLVFNLRLPWQARARVFLGDAGSMLLGLTLAWLAIALTQGGSSTFPPICALWIVLLPLADCVSLMTRRLGGRRSPFAADSQHVHHYLQAVGLSPARSLVVLVGISLLFGAVGFFGWRLRVPETYLFWTFFVAFFAYHFWIKRAWRRLEAAGVLESQRPGVVDEENVPA